MTAEPRLRALGLHDEEVAAILTALGANVPNFTAEREERHASCVRPHGREPLRRPPAHFRMGLGALHG